jgi:PKD repeat protein
MSGTTITSEATHTYTTDGTYTVTVEGTFEGYGGSCPRERTRSHRSTPGNKRAPPT